MKKLFLSLFLLAGMSFGQTTVAPITNPRVQFFNNSVPCAGCLLDTFSAGTTNALATYSESTGTTPNANPVVLGSDGSAVVYLTSASYKFRLRSALGVTIWTQDVISWNTPLTTFAGLTDAGTLTQTQPTAATNVANQSSFSDCMNATYWTGSVSATDSWCLSDILGTGTNPASTFTLTHSGSSGASTFSIPGNVSVGTFAGNPTFSGNVTFAPSGQSELIVDNSQSGVYVSVLSRIRPIIPCPQNSTLFQLGCDLALQRYASADLWESLMLSATTTTASLAASANTNVLIGPVLIGNQVYGTEFTKTAITGFNPGNHPITGTGFTLYIGRETTNFEVLTYSPTANCPTPGTWNIVDGTHLCLNTTKTHSGTTDLEEIGDQYWATPIIHVYSFGTRPANGVLCPNAPLQLQDSVNNYIAFLPSNTGDSWPCNGWRWSAIQTGENGANKNEVHRNNLAASQFMWLANGNTTLMALQETAGAALLQMSNATNTSLQLKAAADIGRIIGGGTSGGILAYGSGLGAGTNGIFAVRNNQTDDAESFRVTTSTSTTAITNGTVSGTLGVTGVATLNGGIKMTNSLISGTAPTIAAGGCGGAAATIATNNGTASFTINVGTTPTSAGCVIGLPSATTAWNCYATDITTNSTSVDHIKQTAAGSGTTAATLVNYSNVSVATAPTASDIWQVSCFAR